MKLVPNTLFEQADWARRPQRLEVDPSIFQNVCLPTLQEQGTIQYDQPTSFVSFMNIRNICIDTRHELYGLFFNKTNCGCSSSSSSSCPKCSCDSGSGSGSGSGSDCNPSGINVPLILALLGQLQGLFKKQCPPNPATQNEQTLQKLIDALKLLQENDNYADLVTETTRQWKAVVELPSTQPPQCPSYDSQFKYIVPKYTDPNPSAPKNCIEEFVYGGGTTCTQPASCLPRKVYTNCLYPPNIDPIVITNPIDIAETFYGFVDENVQDQCQKKICSKRFIQDEIDIVPPQDPCLLIDNSGSGSGSGSGDDIDKCPVRLALFSMSEKFQLTLWTTLIQTLITGCVPWASLQIPFLDKTLLEFFPGSGSGSESGSGSGSGIDFTIYDEFLGRLNYNKVLSYGQLQYQNLLASNGGFANTNIFPKKFVYGQGPTTCEPYMLQASCCAPLNVFSPPAVENNPILDLLPTEFWNQLSEYTNGIIKGYPIANETEFVASEMDLVYPLTPLPFVLRVKIELWLPRPFGFTPVGDTTEAIDKNFVSFQELGINSYLDDQQCLFQTCFSN